ncbi:MAG: D-alanyl-D-alanine carboxypeptidase family protein [Clostridia bacterium]|nr:D-alanyl-D-alanine carboxypeptidase family protein [Clostridia bacterium]
MKFLKKTAGLILILSVIFSARGTYGRDVTDLTAKSYILMESSTGRVLLEGNADTPLPPASITKIMTLLLIMEDIESGKISYDDMVTASERAKSMGGSTIFLEAGERMSVHDLLKGIVVASANDASVAMAEHLEGSVEAFVERMNKRATELGMTNTQFKNTNGLPAEGHEMSARDIAIVSNELLKHKDILNFTLIWTDSLRDGAFQLANTNRLIRFYEGANGLKTGSTDEAGCCISASAERDGMQLIAVVMGSPTSNDRFEDAKALLDYGYSNYNLWYGPDRETSVGHIKVRKGSAETVAYLPESNMYALVRRSETGREELEVETEEFVTAPLKKGDAVGVIKCLLNGEVIAETKLVAASDVERIGFWQLQKKMLGFLLRIK